MFVLKCIYVSKDGAISSPDDKPLKLVDQFINFSINILLTEDNVNIHIGKASASSDRSSTT